MRRRVFEELHGFDERFFMYYEDVDFACRAGQAGWKSYFLADTQAFHRGGGTTERIKERRLFYWMCSRIQYIEKHFGLTAAWTLMAASLWIEFWTRIAWNVVSLSWPHLRETLQAYVLYVVALPRLLRNMHRQAGTKG